MTTPRTEVRLTSFTMMALLLSLYGAGNRVLATEPSAISSTPPLSSVWTRQFGTPQVDDANGVTTDLWGNVYVVGSTTGSVTGNTNAGGSDAYIASFDRNGTLRWIHQWGTEQNEFVWRVVSDRCGGAFAIAVTTEVAGNLSLGSHLVRYDANGQRLWCVPVVPDPTVKVRAYDVCMDHCGRLFVTGTTKESKTFVASFLPCGTLRFWHVYDMPVERLLAFSIKVDRWGCLYVGGNAASLARIIKLDSAGNILWDHTLPDTVLATAVTLDVCDRPIVVGWNWARKTDRNGATTGQANESTPTLESASDDDASSERGDQAIFVAKYQANGQQLWQHQFDQLVASHNPVHATTDPNGRVWLTGRTYRPNSAGFVASLKDDGELAGIDYVSLPAGSSSNTSGGRGIAFDHCGQLHLVGRTSGAVGTDPSVGGIDAYLIKFKRGAGR